MNGNKPPLDSEEFSKRFNFYDWLLLLLFHASAAIEGNQKRFFKVLFYDEHLRHFNQSSSGGLVLESCACSFTMHKLYSYSFLKYKKQSNLSQPHDLKAHVSLEDWKSLQLIFILASGSSSSC